MRKKLIAGNWKMFTTGSAAQELASAVDRGLGSEDRVAVAICPPFPYLTRVATVLRGSKIGLGAQNLYPEKEGAFTGEISPGMLVDAGCTYVIVGHSERRRKPEFAENDAFINRKVHAGVAAGLTVILCLGETLEEREANRTQEILQTQITGSLAGVTWEMMGKLVLAYEPVWAIGTGKNATPDQAQEAHAFVRKKVGEMINPAAAADLIIQYGGSVKPDNAKDLLSQPDVDGALVGGASLKAEQFLPIVKAGIIK
jgi:triosephosphate isomerase